MRYKNFHSSQPVWMCSSSQCVCVRYSAIISRSVKHNISWKSGDLMFAHKIMLFAPYAISLLYHRGHTNPIGNSDIIRLTPSPTAATPKNNRSLFSFNHLIDIVCLCLVFGTFGRSLYKINVNRVSCCMNVSLICLMLRVITFNVVKACGLSLSLFLFNNLIPIGLSFGCRTRFPSETLCRIT